MSKPSLLIVGIGSPHGDDRFGWEVVRRLTALWPNAARDAFRSCEDAVPSALRELASPIDLLHELDGCERLVICDACRGLSEPGEVRSFEWPSDSIESLSGSGSHDFSLVDALRLAERLGRLPASVTIWVVEKSPQQDDQLPTDTVLSQPVATALQRVVQHLAEEYSYA